MHFKSSESEMYKHLEREENDILFCFVMMDMGEENAVHLVNFHFPYHPNCLFWDEIKRTRLPCYTPAGFSLLRPSQRRRDGHCAGQGHFGLIVTFLPYNRTHSACGMSN